MAGIIFTIQEIQIKDSVGYSIVIKLYDTPSKWAAIVFVKHKKEL